MLLCARDNVYRRIDTLDEVTFSGYLKNNHNIDVEEDWSLVLACWARLCLPNGQVARFTWKETLNPPHKVQMAHNVKVSHMYSFGHR